MKEKVRGVPMVLITVAGRKTGVKLTNLALSLEHHGQLVMTPFRYGSCSRTSPIQESPQDRGGRD